MRFVVDECTGQIVVDWLRAAGHDVVSVIESSQGAADPDILTRAAAEDRVLITNDKDFGDLVFRDRHPHAGVVLLRLTDDRPATRIEALERLLRDGAPESGREFTVITDRSIRRRPF